MSGTRNGEPWPPAGEIADVPTGEAQHLVASGIAEELDDEGDNDQSEPEPKAEPEPEVETAAAPDTAEQRPAPRKTAAKKPDTK